MDDIIIPVQTVEDGVGISVGVDGVVEGVSIAQGVSIGEGVSIPEGVSIEV